MKVLFVDRSSLTRLGMVMIAKECRSDLETFEVTNYESMLHILRLENISIVFINANTLTMGELQSIRNASTLRIILVLDGPAKRDIYAPLVPSTVEGVIDLHCDLQHGRDQFARFLQFESPNS